MFSFLTDLCQCSQSHAKREKPGELRHIFGSSPVGYLGSYWSLYICVRYWWLQVERPVNASAIAPSRPLRSRFLSPVRKFPWRHEVQSRPGCGSCHPVLCFTCNLIFIELHFLWNTWTRTEELKDEFKAVNSWRGRPAVKYLRGINWYFCTSAIKEFVVSAFLNPM